MGSTCLKLALLALLIACVFSSVSAECFTNKNLDKTIAWSCRENNSRNGNNLCCPGLSCKCGRELSFYGVLPDYCRCIED